MSIEPTFTGYVSTTLDAFIIFQATISGQLTPVPRRLHASERQTLIQSGAVFVFSEESSKVKRWTDGIAWSPSRILGNFLVYRQLEKPFAPGEKKRVLKASSMSVDPQTQIIPTKSSHRHSVSEPYAYYPDLSSIKSAAPKPAPAHLLKSNPILSNTSPTLADRGLMGSLMGSLIDSYDFHPSGLIKKTMSIIFNGHQHHMVSYYHPEDVLQGRLLTPSQIPELVRIPIDDRITHGQNFRYSSGLDNTPPYYNLTQPDIRKQSADNSAVQISLASPIALPDHWSPSEFRQSRNSVSSSNSNSSCTGSAMGGRKGSITSNSTQPKKVELSPSSCDRLLESNDMAKANLEAVRPFFKSMYRPNVWGATAPNLTAPNPNNSPILTPAITPSNSVSSQRSTNPLCTVSSVDPYDTNTINGTGYYYFDQRTTAPTIFATSTITAPTSTTATAAVSADTPSSLLSSSLSAPATSSFSVSSEPLTYQRYSTGSHTQTLPPQSSPSYPFHLPTPTALSPLSQHSHSYAQHHSPYFTVDPHGGGSHMGAGTNNGAGSVPGNLYYISGTPMSNNQPHLSHQSHQPPPTIIGPGHHQPSFQPQPMYNSGNIASGGGPNYTNSGLNGYTTNLASTGVSESRADVYDRWQ
ncbi:hypothetical protein NADFUDRAFT_71258 [Nadsonia fulvescens var. elongata DSM 6958]|uniref:Camp independent regulatory protein n=1 Tax=Nadsonia fulvescens var. elongata DSM 6958 TaxID=857566 RepID=A0A1E3PFT0_9ASCO|nr:hypothetical protein NADFUDRAFT_71258 [Nadsonia fulvescens var. elongata DSM 6958]